MSQERILENYSLSIHGEGLFRQGLTVTAVCTSCHTSHDILPHTDPRSSIHHDNVAATCTTCHAQIERVHRQVIDGKLWEEQPDRIPACVDCHSPHRIRRVFYTAGTANEDCLKCHGDAEAGPSGRANQVSLYVDGFAHQGSAHGGTRVRPVPHGRHARAGSRLRDDRLEGQLRGVPRGAGGAVHPEHARRRSRPQGDPDAPTCVDCHDKHATLKKDWPTSPTFARNVPQLCSRCHRIGEQAAVRIETDVPDIVQSYVDSIHGKGLLESGLVVTATCASCHTAHMELPPDDPAIDRHHENVADTCGGCHHGIEETFKTSIHWREAIGTGEHELPTCEDCHTSHTISRTDVPGFRFLAMMEPVRALSRGPGQDVLRHVPRQGLETGFRGRGQVLRLPRHARHPARHRSRLDDSAATTSSRPAVSATPGRTGGLRAT